MRRLLITGPRRAIIEDTEMPVCPPDGVLVRARLTAVSSGTELRVFRGIPVDQAGKFLHETVPFEMPTENGYSMVGEVLETGSRVADFSPGDRIFAPAPHKEVAAIPASLLVRLPDNIPDEQAVWLSVLEVAHIAVRRGNLQAGENVAVIGQGVIGLSALAYCLAFGNRVLAIDTDRDRVKMSRDFGASLAISPRDDNFAESVDSFFAGQGADIVFEAASNWRAVHSAMTIAGVDARVVAISRHTSVPDFNPLGHPFLGKRLSLLTSYGYPPTGNRWDRQRSVALTLDLLSHHRLPVDRMITHIVAPDQLPDIYGQLDAGDPSCVGIIVRW